MTRFPWPTTVSLVLRARSYSKNPKKIERAEEEFHVGNLYMNRKCTGAKLAVSRFC